MEFQSLIGFKINWNEKVKAFLAGRRCFNP